MSLPRSADMVPFEWDELLKMSLLDICGEDITNWYNSGGNVAHLPTSRTDGLAWLVLHQAKIISALRSEIQTLKTTKTLGSFVAKKWLYADVSGDPDFLPWATVGLKRPASDDQVLVWINGLAEPNIKISDSGIVIPENLAVGGSAKAVVLSDSLIGAVHRYSYLGSVGTGSGNRTWAIHELPADDLAGQTPNIPDASAKLWVTHAGLEMTEGIDYTLTFGSGTATLVFTSNIADSDVVGFTIFAL